MASKFIPRANKLYRCRYGFKGAEQICLFVGYPKEGEGLLVRKWRAKSGSWTNKVWIAASDLLRPATAKDCRETGLDINKL